MIIKKNEGIVRKGNDIEICNIITKSFSKNFSFAIATLNGQHSKTINNKSDRAYYVLEGSAIVIVGDVRHAVYQGDTVFIPCCTPHSIEGSVRYIVINSPAFDPSDESQVNNE